MSFFRKLSSFSNRGYILAILAIGILTFANMMGNSFVWDDEEILVKNLPVFRLENIPAFFRQATFFSGGSSLSGWFYRPYVMISFLLTKILFGTKPFGFHLVQLALHLANSILVFILFRKLLNKYAKTPDVLAFLLASLFTVHPANVEAVSYIASVAEPLYAFFLLSVFFVILKIGQKVTRLNLFLLIILFLSALLTKESSIILLPIVLIFAYLFDRKIFVPLGISLIAGFVLYLLIRLKFFGFPTQKPEFLNPIGQATITERVLTFPLIFFDFLKTFLFPKTLAVSQHFVVKDFSFLFWLPLTLDLLFLTLAAFFLLKTKNKLGLFFFFWFLLSLIPSVNIILPLDMTFSERWLYFPMIGLLGFLGIVISYLPSLNKSIKLLVVPALMLILIFSIRTIARNYDWKDGYTLYSHDIRISKNSFDLENNLGVEEFRKGQIPSSLLHFKNSVELQPNWPISLNNLAAAYQNSGDEKRAYQYYKESAKKGDYYLAYENLAALLIKERKFKEAVDFLDSTTMLKFPNDPQILFAAAIAYYQTGDQASGLAFAQRLFSLYPSPQTEYLLEQISNKKTINLGN